MKRRHAPPAFVLTLLVGLAALAPAPGRGAENSLGRLFYTPEQRRQLDHLRNLGASGLRVEERAVLRLDGVVRHPDGRITTWINGRPAQAGQVVPGSGPEQARVATEAGKSVPLRVGDALPAGAAAPEPLLGDGQARRDPPRR